ncbi:hypothetical protein GQ43DRAFT_436069 [Delitschia confertaspora ATCC 74209]|uniref:Uncharacterized protein n=1 Tax=Delitschia confertaspora ATCC 74209 TaxID=1513339 RepID=A0A9P4MMR0_9PLEO|nr:hypothetical protein GQ43DRAFT_436069 [Delitschia confertaspora ATCC 74209]
MEGHWSNSLGGRALMKTCCIVLEGIALRTKALLDTRAGGEAFVHHRLWNFVVNNLQAKPYEISEEIDVAGNSNQKTDTIKYYFKAFVVTDGRPVPGTFFFYDTGRHDLLLGRKCHRELAWRDALVGKGVYTINLENSIVGLLTDASPKIIAQLSTPSNYSDLPSSDKQLTSLNLAPDTIPKASRTPWTGDYRAATRKMADQLDPKAPLPEPLSKQRQPRWERVGVSITPKDKKVIIGSITIHELTDLLKTRGRKCRKRAVFHQNDPVDEEEALRN